MIRLFRMPGRCSTTAAVTRTCQGRRRRRGLTLSGGAAALALFGACELLSFGSLSGPQIIDVDIAAQSASAPIGTNVTAVALGATSDGVTVDITEQVEWSSSDPAVVAYIGPGVFRTVGYGNAFIRVVYEGRADGVAVAVGPPPQAPGTPGNLTVATAGRSWLDIGWEHVPYAHWYEVWRGTAGGGPFDVAVYQGPDDGFTDRWLDPGTAYYYVVQAHNELGNSAVSAVASGSTIATTFAYLRSSLGEPWGIGSATELDQAFGAGNWVTHTFDLADPAVIFTGDRLVFVDGSDSGAVELEAFLALHRQVIEDWVAGGGLLFLNAGPNLGAGMSFGFGGVELHYSFESTDGEVYAADPGHPLFDGPNPTLTSYTGSSYSHAYVTGAALTPILIGVNTGEMVLAEREWGKGHVLFGGMTTTNYHYPTPAGTELRVNMLEYLLAQ